MEEIGPPLTLDPIRDLTRDRIVGPPLHGEPSKPCSQAHIVDGSDMKIGAPLSSYRDSTSKRPLPNTPNLDLSQARAQLGGGESKAPS